MAAAGPTQRAYHGPIPARADNTASRSTKIKALLGNLGDAGQPGGGLFSSSRWRQPTPPAGS